MAAANSLFHPHVLLLPTMQDNYSYIPCTIPRSSHVDESRNRFPYCVVWTPLPFLSWFIPFIGHLGIADSQGIIFDFSSPYTVRKDNPAFGKPARYLQLDPTLASSMTWDEAIYKGANSYEKQMHILLWNNCYSFITHTLNLMNYNSTRWNPIKIGWIIFWDAEWCDQVSMLRSYGIFWILILILFLWGVVFRA